MKIIYFCTLVLAIWLACTQKLYALPTSFSVDTLTNMVDANAAPFNQVKPGDTILFEPGNRDFILIRNFTGIQGIPIIFCNIGGLVTIHTDHYFGISIQNCRFIRLTGTGSETDFYGFKITRVSNGGGVGITDMSSDFEIDHVSIENTSIGGIYAKTDPDCSLASTRGNYTQYNTIIHDNYIANTSDEGMYIGSTKFFGQTVSCNDKDTLLLPSLLDGVRIYNNIIKFSGWDGIQVSSASTDCQVFDNLIMYDSQRETFGQMSGIMLGGGSKCDCYNNVISQGKGSGIESHGLGGYRIFNNIIVDAGRSFQPLDTSLMKYGIYITDISAQPDSSFHVMHNDIINPKSDGIRFLSVLSKGSFITSNVIINPGTYDYYERLHTSFSGQDSYVMLPDSSSDVFISNNYFSRTTIDAGFEASGYTLKGNSPLVDAGNPDLKGIIFDGYHNPRIYGKAPDIGALEYNPNVLNINNRENNSEMKPLIFPNPVKTWLTIHFRCTKEMNVALGIFNLQGNRLMSDDIAYRSDGEREIKLNVTSLHEGIYIYQLKTKQQTVSGKFLKVNR
ncbi:MAG: T9SS type A sorting domain-containing protein [Bacteroidota bacterium]